MKRLIIGSIIIAAALLLSSCSIGGVNSDMFKKPSDRELADARFEQIVTAIENSDKNGIKEMFSKSAQQEAEDIDEEIEQLLVLFPNGIDSWESMGAYQTSESRNDGNREKSITSQYYVNVGDKQYRFLFMDRTINRKNPDKVGLFGIDIVDEENNVFRAIKAGIYIAVE